MIILPPPTKEQIYIHGDRAGPSAIYGDDAVWITLDVSFIVVLSRSSKYKTVPKKKNMTLIITQIWVIFLNVSR